MALPISKSGSATQKQTPAKENGVAGAHAPHLNGALANGTANGSPEREETRVPLSRNASTAGDQASGVLPFVSAGQRQLFLKT